LVNDHLAVIMFQAKVVLLAKKLEIPLILPKNT